MVMHVTGRSHGGLEAEPQVVVRPILPHLRKHQLLRQMFCSEHPPGPGAPPETPGDIKDKSSDASGKVRDRVLYESTVRKAAQDRRWRVLFASGGGPIAGIVGSSSSPRSLEATLVVGLAEQVHELIASEQTARAPGSHEHLIAIIAGSPEAPAVLTTQRALLEGGADDIILLPRSTAELRLAVDMSVVRLQHRGALRQLSDQRVQRARQQVLESLWEAQSCDALQFPELDAGIPNSLSAGTRVGACVLEEFIGRGASGDVFLATNCEVHRVEAVKAVSKRTVRDIRAFLSLKQEIELATRFDHPNIPRVYGALHGPCHIFLRMEYAGPHNLYHAIETSGGRLRPEVAFGYHAQLSSAVAHCHSKQLAHCDLKPENACVENGRVMLLDFGNVVLTSRMCPAPLGTMPFMAAEVMAASEDTPFSPAPADIWSLGVLLLEMLQGVGTLSDTLGWSANVQPSAERSQELRELLVRSPTFWREALPSRTHPQAAKLEATFVGLLQLQPRARWDAADAARIADAELERPSAPLHDRRVQMPLKERSSGRPMRAHARTQRPQEVQVEPRGWHPGDRRPAEQRVGCRPSWYRLRGGI